LSQQAALAIDLTMAKGIPTSLLATFLALGAMCTAASIKLSAPQMGWNSYNYYACDINETIIVDNAKALVGTGLNKLGYQYVTPDCGWFSGLRDSDGALGWNLTSFPSGGQGLGDIIHALGLKFGVYSDAGYWQCGSLNQLQGSLGRNEFPMFLTAQQAADLFSE
jgi:alpha-galactosidase